MQKPKNYYCHRKNNSEMFPNQSFMVLNKIGEGAFGEVYKVFNEKSCNIEVIKKTKNLDKSSNLMMKQTQIISELENSDGFAKLMSKNEDEGYFAMTLLGESVQQIVDKSKVNIIDVKRIAFQCIQRLEELHQKGYVHRDIKPDNILMGNQTHPHKIYLVDFGLSTTFKKNAKIARKIYDGQIGTVKYCSIAAHNGLQQFPKDDLQSLGYSLIFLATKKLPWSSLNAQFTDKQRYAEIKKIKQKRQLDGLCQGISCIRKFMNVVLNLKIGQNICYDKLLQFFKIQCRESYCFSFCSGKCFANLLKKEEEKGQNDDEAHPIHYKKENQLALNKSYRHYR